MADGEDVRGRADSEEDMGEVLQRHMEESAAPVLKDGVLLTGREIAAMQNPTTLFVPKPLDLVEDGESDFRSGPPTDGVGHPGYLPSIDVKEEEKDPKKKEKGKK